LPRPESFAEDEVSGGDRVEVPVPLVWIGAVFDGIAPDMDGFIGMFGILVKVQDSGLVDQDGDVGWVWESSFDDPHPFSPVFHT
jgi:hypothetical protein